MQKCKSIKPAVQVQSSVQTTKKKNIEVKAVQKCKSIKPANMSQMKTHETYTTLNEIYKGNPVVYGFGGHAWIETEGEICDYADEVLLGEMGGRKGEIVRKPFPVELQKEVMKVEWKRYKKTLKWNRKMNPKSSAKEVDDYYKYMCVNKAGRCASRVFIIMEMCKERKVNYKIVFGSCGVQQGKDVWWEYG